MSPARSWRSPIALMGGAAAVGAGIQVGPAVTWLRSVRMTALPRLSGLGRPGHLALTFDDGPDPQGTPAVLDALETLGWHATFFMLGSMVRRAPGLAAEVVAAGHEVALHGDEHRYLLGRTPGAVQTDLRRGLDAIADATGCAPRWFRPPYGVLTGPAWFLAQRLGLTTVLWSTWGRDWAGAATPDGVSATLQRGELDAGTALLHDSDVSSAPGSWRTTVAALPLLAEAVERRGLQVGPLCEHLQ